MGFKNIERRNIEVEVAKDVRLDLTLQPGDTTTIQEFNTQEVPKAEYGWKPGAIVNVGLRSGDNTLRGYCPCAAAYAAIAIISCSLKFATTFFISAAAAPLLAPV
jgi:hypothetical protein